jgi:polyvinyl alcohol dehydrogenase (cytochrome)
MGRIGAALALLIFLVLAPRGEGGATGEALYRERCAQCHDAGVGRAPQTEALRQMPGRRIFLALMSGAMSTQAAG